MNRSGGDLLVCRFAVSSSVTLIPSLNFDAGEHAADELVAVESPPASLGGVQELVGHRERGLSEPAPFVTCVRSFTVAKLDSIGFVVRRCRQCSAGKS